MFRIITIFVVYVINFFLFNSTSRQHLFRNWPFIITFGSTLWIHSLYASISSGSTFVNDKIPQRILNILHLWVLFLGLIIIHAHVQTYLIIKRLFHSHLFFPNTFRRHNLL